MKTIFSIVFFMLTISLTSCRETKTEDNNNVETAVDSIQSIEEETVKMVEQLDQEAKDIDQDLQDLENLDQ
ncbi:MULTISPECIES: hypothetical protein [Mesoflavibacter]|uniref:Lipoprotein n=1 Tax=Mesoflavibacter zeaxanthinifaciens subsp. sabulilitoris TaxID=1520893 RepID=A0A2T1NFE5_9FLAO|nr:MULTISPECIES: hypothetical protein [Mesoflavibacter]MBB3124754.1 hypothetical protein [Mesoflavibacter zeaxanthinifaciens subsp. sabulilitoris]MCP4054098.1 hypothetical protein [Mesoflavibacter sp.]PSG91150.1 hypothetical protein C7H61_07830 [Mesoflavibacter zeaxanthinifaciens subsp. sabulilitoris]UAB74828.1 hypothetical protein INR78_10585 [Mesoflavibacter sp. SCSIO 43206]